MVNMICRMDNSGLGTLSWEFARNLKPDKVLLVENEVNQTFPERYAEFETRRVGRGMTPQDIDWILDGDIVLSFETFYDYSIIKKARERGVKTALMTMFEMMPERGFPLTPDILLCPSQLDYDFYDHDNKHLVQVPVATDRLFWKERKEVKHFIHTGSHAGMNDRKGTQTFLDAIPLVKGDAKFTIYTWKNKWRVPDDPRIELKQINFKNYWQLYREGDVLVYPQGGNGICLPIVEAWASGMGVITTDIYPFNTYMPKEMLFPATKIKNRMGRGLVEVDDYQIDPQDIANKINEYINQYISDISARGRAWAQENSWEKLKPFYEQIFNDNRV